MKKQDGWAYAEDVQSETYTGLFSTREEAIAEGLASFEDSDSVAVAEAVYPDPAELISHVYGCSLDTVLERLDELANDDAWYSNDAPLFEVRDGQLKPAQEALASMLTVWATAYLEPQAWTAKNPETVLRSA